jgi:hypothetical protein
LIKYNIMIQRTQLLMNDCVLNTEERPITFYNIITSNFWTKLWIQFIIEIFTARELQYVIFKSDQDTMTFFMWPNESNILRRVLSSTHCLSKPIQVFSHFMWMFSPSWLTIVASRRVSWPRSTLREGDCMDAQYLIQEGT